MHILPITSITTYTPRCRNDKIQPAFTAHPDFYGYNSTQSCYFRRGAVALESKGYRDIEKTFESIFNTKENKMRNMLIIGIGESQEPFSYLASIKSILEEKPLNKNLDLHTIDLQSKPDNKTIWEHAFYDGYYDYKKVPPFGKGSFVKDRQYPEDEIVSNNTYYPYPLMFKIKKQNEHKQKEILDYRVNDEILGFLKETYNNPSKSHWDSPVQEVIKELPSEKFDVVSANNVIPYIINENQIIETIGHIKRILKTGGYYITDPYYPPMFIQESGVLDDMTQIYPGIYQKTA